MNLPKIPTGPITIGLNGMILDSIFKKFVQRYLPAYEIEITSGYRSPAENEAIGGAEYSAHMYNLAKDFVLKNKGGHYLPTETLKQVYEEFIKPYWEGYSSYNPPKTGNTGWIHVNIDRDITNKTKVVETAAGALAIGMAIRKVLSKIRKGRTS